MLRVDRVIREDDCVGTVRRTIHRAVCKQLTGAAREEALARCRSIKGGVLVKRPPANATVLRYAGSRELIIPVDDSGRLVRL